MEVVTYKPKGVCSSSMTFYIEDDIVQHVEIKGGCDGNLKGISKLLEGMKVEEVISRLEGIRCGFKKTSCPDQMSIALKEYLNK